MSKTGHQMQKPSLQNENDKLRAENARLREQLEIANLRLIHAHGGSDGGAQALIEEFLRQKKVYDSEMRGKKEELEFYQRNFPQEWLDTIVDDDTPPGFTDVAAFFAFSNDQEEPQSIILLGRSPADRATTVANVMEKWHEATWMLPHPLDFGGKNIEGIEPEDWASIFQDLVPLRYTSHEDQYRNKRAELFSRYWPKITEKNPASSRSELQTNFNRNIERTLKEAETRRFSHSHKIVLLPTGEE